MEARVSYTTRDVESVIVTFYGNPVRKSDRMITTASQISNIKSPKVQQWYNDAVKVTTQAVKGHFKDASKKRPLEIFVWAFHKDDRGDLSAEAVMDALQLTGIINDDRYIHRTVTHKLYDKANPRTVVMIQWLPTDQKEQWRRTLSIIRSFHPQK